MKDIFRRAELVGLGLSWREINNLLRAGRLVRLGHNWYSNGRADPDLLLAARLHGRVAGLSACRLYGLWVPQFSKPQIAIGNSRALPHSRRGVVFHRIASLTTELVVPLVMALQQVVRRECAETALIVIESAIEKGLINPGDLEEILASTGRRGEYLRRYLSPGAQSGSETRVRFFLARRGVKVRPQVRLQGVGRVDLMMGRSYLIEIDSRAHHSQPKDVNRDCIRDSNSGLLGYRVLRLSWEQIWRAWDDTQALLRQIISTGQHRRRPRPIGALLGFYEGAPGG